MAKSIMQPDLMADLSLSQAHALFIDINYEEYFTLLKEQSNSSILALAQQSYNKGIPAHQTHILYVQAQPGVSAQIFQALIAQTNQQLFKELQMDALINLAAWGASQVLGDSLTGAVDGLFDQLSSSLGEFVGLDWLSDKVNSAIGDTVEDLTESVGQRLGEHSQNNAQLILSKAGKARLGELAQIVRQKHSPHQAMDLALSLVQAIAIDAPKLIVIDNPSLLDHGSLSMLGSLFSKAKDQREHLGISVLCIETQKPSAPDSAPSAEDLDLQKISKYQLSRLRQFVQRYGQYERPGVSMPVPAVRSDGFVGRQQELQQMSSKHKSYLEFVANQNASASPVNYEAQILVIQGEPGTGKTTLVHQHLSKHMDSNEQKGQITLKLLNQSGPSAQTVGLSSINQSIEQESFRLMQRYREQQHFGTRWADGVKNAIIEVIDTSKSRDPKTMVDCLKKLTLNFTGTKRLVDSSQYFLASYSLGNDLNQSLGSSFDTQGNDQKTEMFNQLDEKVQALLDLSKLADPKCPPRPILLFVDDLQWLDDQSAEYLCTRLLKNNWVQLVLTARVADSRTEMRKALEFVKERPYLATLFTWCGLFTEEEIENQLQGLGADQQSAYQAHLAEMPTYKSRCNITLKGMDHHTLVELIDQNFEGESYAQDLLASKLISYLNESSQSSAPNEDLQVVTLFAVETLNLISDAGFCQRHKLDPIIMSPNRGTYRLIDISATELAARCEHLFEGLSNAHRNSYQKRDRHKQQFSLASYAVLEERLIIIKEYFAAHGDVTVFSLYLAAMLGISFNSVLVSKLIQSLGNIDTDDYPGLAPLKCYLNQRAPSKPMTDIHYQALQQAFEIIRRIDQHGVYRFSHSLLNVFLKEQLADWLTDNLSNEPKVGESAHKDTDRLTFFTWLDSQIEQYFQSSSNINNTAASASDSRNRQIEKLSLLFQTWEMALQVVEAQNTVVQKYVDSAVLVAIQFREAAQESKALPYLEPAMKQLKKCYNINKKYWAESWVKSLSWLGTCYRNLDRAIDAISCEEEALDITRNYIEGDDPERWTKVYVSLLRNLALSYGRCERLNDAVVLNEEALNITRKLCPRAPEYFIDDHILNLQNLAGSYDRIGRTQDAFSLREETLDFLGKVDPSLERWANHYANCLTGLSISYNREGRISDSTPLLEKVVKIRKEQYDNDGDHWAEDYIISQSFLASNYLILGRKTEAIALVKVALELTQERHENDPERWSELYQLCQESLAAIDDNLRGTAGVIPLEEEDNQDQSLELQPEVLCRQLLADQSKLHGLTEKAISYEEEALGIARILFGQSPVRGFELYLNCINNLASSYSENGKNKNALQLYCEVNLADLDIEQRVQIKTNQLKMLNKLERYSEFDELANELNSLFSNQPHLELHLAKAWFLGVKGNSLHQRNKPEEAKRVLLAMSEIIAEFKLDGFAGIYGLLDHYGISMDVSNRPL